MAETQLQAAIVAYLRSKLSSVKEPDSLAVGINCILEAFELSDKAVNSADVQSLLAAFSGESSSPAPQSVEDDPAFRKFMDNLKAKGFFNNLEEGSPAYADRYKAAAEKFKSRAGTSAAAGAGAAAAASPNDDALAEKLKSQGNDALSAGKHAEAVKFYSQAIAAAPTGKSAHIYYANRAAAQTSLKQFAEAVEDARKATQIDPTYAKGWSRLGAALQLQGKAGEAVSAYEKACDLDPSNGAAKDGLASARKAATGGTAVASGSKSTTGASAPAPGAGGFDPSMLAGLAGGLGGGAGGLAGLMQNPMVQNMMKDPAMMQMAMNMMKDPAAMQNMMGMMGGAGGLGGLASTMGGMGGGAAPAPGAVNDEYDDMPDLQPQ